MKILVTGGGGYLGSIFCRKMLAKGHKVRVLDALWYGNESLEELSNNADFELVQEDIRNLVTTVSTMKDMDAVVHLASIVGMPASSIDPIASEEVNYLAAKNIAELCQLHEIETFVFASTCSIYGSQPNTVITEKSKVSPMDFYATQKYLSEKATHSVNRSPLILRFGTLFGYSPRMRFDLVINLFTAQAIKEGKITVFGGKQNRPFLHVDDAAESIVFGLEKNLTGIYNVISENLTLLQAAEKVSKITGCEIQIKTEVEDERHYNVSADKLSLTGFSASKKLDDGIKEIIDALSDGKINDFKDKKYSNYEILLSKHETDEIIRKRLLS